MKPPIYRKTKGSFWPVFLLALGLGWVLYRFVNAEPVSLRDTPPPKPAIVPRAEWGARPLNLEAPEEFGLFDPQTNPDGVLYYPSDLRDVLNTIVIHHSAIPTAGPNAIQRLQMDGRGFADVAYHFLIDSAGTIYPRSLDFTEFECSPLHKSRESTVNVKRGLDKIPSLM